MDNFDPFQLFPTAYRFDGLSNPPTPMVDESSDGAVRRLRSGTTVTNVFALGSGTQLVTWCANLGPQFRDLVVQVEDDATWFHQLPEVHRLLHTFLAEAGELPAML